MFFDRILYRCLVCLLTSVLRGLYHVASDLGAHTLPGVILCVFMHCDVVGCLGIAEWVNIQSPLLILPTHLLQKKIPYLHAAAS